MAKLMLKSSSTSSPYILDHEINASFSYLTMPNTKHQIRVDCKNMEGGELGIFSAEKYFNGSMDEASSNLQSLVTPEIRKESSSPSLDSEEKTRNEIKVQVPQGLLRTRSQRRRTKMSCYRILAAFASACACSDDKSVKVDANANANANAAKKHKITDVNEKVDSEEIKKVHSEEIKEIVLIKESFLPSETKPTLVEADTIEKSPCMKVEDIAVQNDVCFSFPVLNSEARVSAAAAAEKISDKDYQGNAYENTDSDSSSDLFEIGDLEEQEMAATALSADGQLKMINAAKTMGGINAKAKSDSRTCQRSLSFTRKDKFHSEGNNVLYNQCLIEQRSFSRSLSMGSRIGGRFVSNIA